MTTSLMTGLTGSLLAIFPPFQIISWIFQTVSCMPPFHFLAVRSLSIFWILKVQQESDLTHFQPKYQNCPLLWKAMLAILNSIIFINCLNLKWERNFASYFPKYVPWWQQILKTFMIYALLTQILLSRFSTFSTIFAPIPDLFLIIWDHNQDVSRPFPDHLLTVTWQLQTVSWPFQTISWTFPDHFLNIWDHFSATFHRSCGPFSPPTFIHSSQFSCTGED